MSYTAISDFLNILKQKKFTCELTSTTMAEVPCPIPANVCKRLLWSRLAWPIESVLVFFVFLVDSQSSPFLFLWPRTQAKGYLKLSSYTSEPWRFNELFSTDTKVIVGTSQVGSGELQGKLQRTEVDELGESGEFIRLEKYHKCSGSDWHLL